MLDERTESGAQRYTTVAEVAAALGVSRATLYRALTPAPTGAGEVS